MWVVTLGGVPDMGPSPECRYLAQGRPRSCIHPLRSATPPASASNNNTHAKAPALLYAFAVCSDSTARTMQLQALCRVCQAYSIFRPLPKADEHAFASRTQVLDSRTRSTRQGFRSRSYVLFARCPIFT